MPLKSPQDTRIVITTRRSLRSRFSLGPALLAAALSFWSCAADRLEGRLVLSGSATLGPLASKAVALWHGDHTRVDVRTEVIGSDAGLDRLIRYSDADLALISRPLTDEDRKAAVTAGKDLIDLPLAWDAVCLVVPRSNGWAQTLSPEQTAQAFTTAVLWSDLDPSWPSRPIHRFVLGPNSGTADVFAAVVLAGQKDRLYRAPGIQASEDDRILARGIGQVDGALGFLGWSTYQDLDKSLRTLGYNGVSPGAQSIRDGSYGLPRRLWLVADRHSLSPATRSFLKFLYEQYASLTAGTGLIPLTEPELHSVQALLNANL